MTQANVLAIGASVGLDLKLHWQVASGPALTAISMGAGSGGAGTALGMVPMRMTAGAAAVDLTTGEGAAAALLTPMALTGAGPGMVASGGSSYSPC